MKSFFSFCKAPFPKLRLYKATSKVRRSKAFYGLEGPVDTLLQDRHIQFPRTFYSPHSTRLCGSQGWQTVSFH